MSPPTLFPFTSTGLVVRQLLGLCPDFDYFWHSELLRALCLPWAHLAMTSVIISSAAPAPMSSVGVGLGEVSGLNSFLCL